MEITHKNLFKAVEEEKTNVINLYALGFPRTEKESIDHSIAKWETIAEIHRKMPNSFVTNTNNTTCALCNLFLDARDHSCDGCPVKEFTNGQGCRYTPYKNYINAVDDKEKIRYAEEFVELLKEIRDNYNTE